MRSRNSTRTGFTLLEMLLTLALTLVVVGLISAMLRFYALDLNNQEQDVQRVHLASAIMRMIRRDLQAVGYSEPIDVTGLEASMSSLSSGEGLTSSAQAEGVEDLSAAGLDSGVEDPAAADDAMLVSSPVDLDLSTGAGILERPGLIGNQNQLQIDISRPPRMEEWQQQLNADASVMQDIPSDMKTVTYYVQPPGMAGGVPDAMQQLAANAGMDLGTNQSDAVAGAVEALPGGLVRRQMDRMATNYALQNGLLASLGASGDLLSTETIGIEFEYWDGTLWQYQWSSDEMQGLPMAVKVTVHFQDDLNAEGLSGDTGGAQRSFQQIVRLPLARIPTLIDETETGTSDTATSTTATDAAGAIQ